MLELAFFDGNPLVLDAVRSIVRRPGVATVRRVAMDWRVMDMKAAAGSDMDALFAFANCEPADGAWHILQAAFPDLRSEAEATCKRLNIRSAPGHFAAANHNICVDGGGGRGPLVVLYLSSGRDAAYRGFSAMMRLAPEHCTIGIPCVGNVFGTRAMAVEAMDGLMMALDDSLVVRSGGGSDELGGQDHADVSEIAYGVLYDQGEVGLQPERAGGAQGARLGEERQELE